MAFINSASSVDGVGIRAIEDGIQQIIAVAAIDRIVAGSTGETIGSIRAFSASV